MARLWDHDLVGWLPRNDRGGPRLRVPVVSKWGAIIHYNGPAISPEADPRTVLRNDAIYHINKVWGYDGAGNPLYGDGLQYHLAVDQAGVAYRCREVEDVLWHCGSWPENAQALAILVMIGEGQHATAEQIDRVRAILDEWMAMGRTDRAAVKGHQEVSATACPGTLMRDLVWPYRAGELQPMARYVFFPETGHGVGGGFLDFFEEHGGVRVFGFPVTEEFHVPDPKAPDLTKYGVPKGCRRIQVFEAAVLEWHPEEPDPRWHIQRRLLGNMVKDALVAQKVE